MEKKFPWQFSKNVWLLGNAGYPFFLAKGKNTCAFVEGSFSCVAQTALSHFESLNLEPPLKYLIIAHAHSDHVCGFIKIKQTRPDLILIGSKETAKVLAKEKIVTHFAHEDMAYGNLLFKLNMVGAPPKKLDGTPVVVDMLITHGQVIDLGETRLRVIAAPGHAPGGFCFFIEPDKTLLISDSAGLGKSLTEIYPLFFHNFSDYVKTLEELKTYAPQRLALAHNLTIDGASKSLDFLNCAIDAAYDMKNNMAKKVESGVSEEDVARDWAFAMKNFGIFGHFPQEILLNYTRLLLRRALEA